MLAFSSITRCRKCRVRRLRRRERRQHRECLVAEVVEAASNRNPIVVFVIGLFATASVSDIRIAQAGRAVRRAGDSGGRMRKSLILKMMGRPTHLFHPQYIGDFSRCDVVPIRSGSLF